MKLSLNDVTTSIQTKVEESSLTKEIYIARSAVAIQINNTKQPIFGFGASFDRIKCEKSSIYELLEHLVFTPYAHSSASLNSPVKYISNNSKNLFDKDPRISQFLLGATHSTGQFYGNGCSISDNIEDAINHSRNELLERHLCCEIWYKRSRPLIKMPGYSIPLLTPSIKLEFYTTNISNINFGIASLDCNNSGFFALGAAIRPSLTEAFEHAACEVFMIYEDMKKNRTGFPSIGKSQLKTLSLRSRDISRERKKYFLSLIKKTHLNYETFAPNYNTIYFEPFPKIYAARSFADNALDPRKLEPSLEKNTLPLF